MKAVFPYITIIRFSDVGVVFAIGAGNFYGVYHSDDFSPYNHSKANDLLSINSFEDLLDHLFVELKVDNNDDVKNQFRDDVIQLSKALPQLEAHISKKIVIDNDKVTFKDFSIDELLYNFYK